MSGMQGFETRQQLEERQRIAFEKYLSEKGYQFVRCGVELENASVHKNNPDYITISPDSRVSFVELKNAPVISKYSYEHCLSLDRKTPVYFVISSQGRAAHRQDRFYTVRARDIEFKTVSQMTGSPKMLTGSEVWRVDNTGGSGQPYGIVNLSCTQEMPGLTYVYENNVN
jgi:hypothetical protein